MQDVTSSESHPMVATIQAIEKLAISILKDTELYDATTIRNICWGLMIALQQMLAILTVNLVNQLRQITLTVVARS